MNEIISLAIEPFIMIWKIMNYILPIKLLLFILILGTFLILIKTIVINLNEKIGDWRFERSLKKLRRRR